MRKIAWLNSRPYCWAASVDAGKTYIKLYADDDKDSSQAVDEAADKLGGHTSDWEVLDDPISSLIGVS